MTESPAAPLVSVVVPAFNAGEDLDRCLAAIHRCGWPLLEVLVVDDASHDASAREAAARHGAGYLRLDENRGPGIARNRGTAQARGGIIMFVDADVAIHEDAIARAVAALEDGADAVFGSYDDRPTHPSFLSRYRNLYHHWVHQQGAREASTFWTGCSAIRREAFEAVGGFSNVTRQPGVEDIELGYRLGDAGFRIVLCKELQCTHMKRWDLGSLVRTDILDRGVPWMILLLNHRGKARDLNLDTRSRTATLAAGVLLAALALAMLDVRFLWLAAGAAGAIVVAQRGFLDYVRRLHGPGFALAAVPAQLLFFACCAVSVPLGVAAWMGQALRQRT